jgi:CxxC motif-containing protein (DUF1111 family)
MKARIGSKSVLSLFAALVAISVPCLADSRVTRVSKSERIAAGKELFTREWEHGDRRSFAGDGLGPVHNAKSCVACHNQGGFGGSGSSSSNSTIVSTFVDSTSAQSSILSSFFPVPAPQPDREKLAEINPALRTQSSFTLHRFPLTDTRLEQNASRSMPVSSNGKCESGTKVGEVNVALVQSQRNTPALFGTNLIESIPATVLESVAAEQAAGTKQFVKSATLGALLDSVIGEGESKDSRIPLPISGRVARLPQGRVGKFGWKASVATLHEFTLQACSNELGLEVPGAHRPAPPGSKNYKAPGLDLSADQCLCLTDFILALPRPVTLKPQTEQHAPEIAAGQKVFASMGCVQCHRDKLGDVDGIYSDLLLHDMGKPLGASGSYANTSSVEFVKAENGVEPLPVLREGPSLGQRPAFGAGQNEWRTPPLWGLRDSAPYLHDGRADTIEEAIKLHDGEGAMAARAFEKLTPRERMQLDMFLMSLAAPGGN